MIKRETFKIPNLDLVLEIHRNDEGYVQATEIKKVSFLKQKEDLELLGDVKVDLLKISNLTEFQIQVYKVLKKVKPGKVLTYKELASKMGNPLAARAIGSAMRRNPVPYLIPCHRVVRGDGVIGQFSAQGGAKTKALLLESEGISLSHDGRIV